MSILERYANFYAKKLGTNNVKIARFHWSRKSRDSCPTSSVFLQSSKVRREVTPGKGLKAGAQDAISVSGFMV